MDTNLTLLIITVILFIALLIFDFAFFRFRERKFDEGEPLSYITQNMMRSFQAWLEAVRQPKVNEPSYVEAEAGAPPQRNFATPAMVQQNPVVESAPLRSEALAVSPDQPLVQRTQERPVVRVQVTADIPEGTVVHLTMQVTDSDGRVSVQKNVLATNKAVAVPRRQPAPVGGGINFRNIVPWFVGQVDKIRSGTMDLQSTLFWGAIILYAIVISFGIDQWPIYFFTDEAIHMNMIADFLADGFKNYDGEFLPTFFIKEGWVNGTSVYIQLLPYLLFGKSLIVTRLVSAVITLCGAIAVGLLLQKILKVKYYWAGVFLLLITPAWFLHGRTAFEYAELASFYAIFLYFYGRYRKGDMRSLYLAIVAASLCFYTHGLGQILTGVTGLALFIVDFRYHIHRDRRSTVLIGLALGIVLLLPFVRYYLGHPTEIADQVKRRNSYWSNSSLSLDTKIIQYLSQYFYGLNPKYWYFQNDIDIDRHIMKGFGNGLWITLPFMAIGFYQLFKTIRNIALRIGIIASITVLPFIFSHLVHDYTEDGLWKAGVTFPLPIEASVLVNGLWVALFFFVIGLILAFINIRNPAHKMALIIWLACPVPASVVAIGMPRTLWISISMAILTGIGISTVLRWTEEHLNYKPSGNAWRLFAALSILSIFLLRSAVVDGPVWFDDYGLYGMQFGAKQIFQERIRPALESDPNISFVVSPSWANGTEQFVSFFIPEDMQNRVFLGQPVDHTDNLAMFELSQFVSTATEYNNLTQDPKFIVTPIGEPIMYPNGQPGFYFVSVKPSENLEEILAAQHAEKRNPVEGTMLFRGEQIRVVHSPIGSGTLEDMFDTDPDSLSRVEEANPYYIALYPTTPIDTNSVFIKTGSLHDYTITIRLYPVGGGDPVEYSQTYADEPDKDLPPDPEVEIIFDQGPAQSERVEIEIKDNLSGETSSVHVRTIEFK